MKKIIAIAVTVTLLQGCCFWFSFGSLLRGLDTKTEAKESPVFIIYS